jgi:hypothetical protein
MGIFDIFTGDSAGDAAHQNRLALADNMRYGNAALKEGQAGSLASLDKAGAMYAPLSQKYGAGTNLYLDSLGVNGAEGNTRATGAFQAGPGYQWAVDQALDGVNRASSAQSGGGLQGNTLAALSDRAGNMANQEYGNWQTRLGGLIAPEFQATAGQAGAEAGKVPVYQGTANSIANLGTQTTNGITQQNTQQANAETAASGNMWNFGLQALTGLAGGGGGGTSLLGGLGSMFGGGQTMTNPYNSMPKIGSGW